MAKNHHFFISSLLTISLLLLLTSMSKVQVRAQNLCFSQFALANQACSPVGPPIRRKLEALLHPKGELVEGDDDDDKSDSDDKGDSDDKAGSDDGGSEDDDDHSSHQHHHHRRQQHHEGFKHHEGFNPEDTPCCRRLMDIDNACVCQIFARLPKFVTKPKHVMSLSPVEGCEVTFECDGN
ncbi:Tetratricopeptide repeat (TPR)-like superfamily protein [Rhynchospora pubera]|nr:Tetratricopeptide repeat (TPR)-like superfamily protein [Rhynchospora pubera]KAJ4806490.1 Tetratricopeptide repeat (TPR)-like superfamily protein [Rhynchospora pubera]